MENQKDPNNTTQLIISWKVEDIKRIASKFIPNQEDEFYINLFIDIMEDAYKNIIEESETVLELLITKKLLKNNE